MNPNPLDFNYAFSSPDGNSLFGTYSIIFFVVVTIGFLISNYFYYFGKYRYKSNLLSYTIVNKASRNAAIAFTLGFVFFLCRLVQLPPFSARIFLDLVVVMLAYFIIRGIIYITRVYPKAKEEWLNLQIRNRRKNEPEAVPAGKGAAQVKATVAAPASVATASADAGSEENTIRPAAPATPRGLSTRGQKRRERKRDRR